MLYKKPVIHTLTIITCIYIIYYFYWRIDSTLNDSALAFSILLLVGEFIGIIDFYLFAFMTWNTETTKPNPPIEKLSVDVFIPTYNEDLEILEATLIGCLNMRYPHTTYVLDDGRREEVENLAAALGCRYLTRPDNIHAKAGNINEALKKTSGDFIAIMDADMVPQPDFLEKTLGYFEDPKTAIVQLPQEFYNIDSMQHADRKGAHWHEQQLFYHVIQPGKNNINASFWCGSPSVVRRTALLSIGGVATESITEDFLTSIKLNSNGWNIKFHHEVLAFGIAPQTLFAFTVQRLRWAQGSMKILKSRYNPLVARNLTLKQRFSHFSAIFTYFDSYQKLIFLIVPVIYLATGIMPIKITSGVSFLLNWAPYFVLVLLTDLALGRGYFKFFEVEKYNTLKMFTFIKASFTLIRSRGLPFRVTPKTVESTIIKKERNELKAQFVILIIIILSVLVGFVKVILGLYSSYATLFTILVAIFWSIFNTYILILSLYDVLKRLYNRRDYRFPVKINADIVASSGQVFAGTVYDISSGGVRITIQSDDLIAGEIIISLTLPDGTLDVSGDVAYNKSIGTDQIVGIKFRDLPLETKKRLYLFLFVTMPRTIYDDNRERASERKEKETTAVK